MKENINFINTPNFFIVGGNRNDMKNFLMEILKECMSEISNEKKFNTSKEDKRITSDELCERWDMSKSTLYAREKEGIISPLPVRGKRKIYSMSSVLDVENSGILKRVC